MLALPLTPEAKITLTYRNRAFALGWRFLLPARRICGADSSCYPRRSPKQGKIMRKPPARQAEEIVVVNPI